MAYSKQEIHSAISAVKRDIINKVHAKVEKAVDEYYETLPKNYLIKERTLYYEIIINK